jgi:hypothetical protein
VANQCDQIGQYFAFWDTLGYFLLGQFSPKQAVSTHGLLWTLKDFNFGLMLMFWTFKSSFNVDIFWPLFPNIGLNFSQFSGNAKPG